MATLDNNERQQLRQVVGDPTPVPRRWELQPIRDYLAFLRFASRFNPQDKAKPINAGNQWKL